MTDFDDYWSDTYDDANPYPYDEDDYYYDDDWVNFQEIAEAADEYASASMDSYE